jgi:hypothetical protein
MAHPHIIHKRAAELILQGKPYLEIGRLLCKEFPAHISPLSNLSSVVSGLVSRARKYGFLTAPARGTAQTRAASAARLSGGSRVPAPISLAPIPPPRPVLEERALPVLVGRMPGE